MSDLGISVFQQAFVEFELIEKLETRISLIGESQTEEHGEVEQLKLLICQLKISKIFNT
jgi:hypothetical protein